VYQVRATRPYTKSTLFERFGAEANLVDLRLILAHDCPKIGAGKAMDLCGMVHPELIGK
jgi:hypothetical protein